MISKCIIFAKYNIYYSLLATPAALVAIFGFLFVLYVYLLSLWLLGVLGKRLTTGHVLLISDLNARVVPDFDLVLLYFVEGGLSEESEYLLYVGAILSRSFNEGYVPLLGEPKPLLKGDFPPALV